MVKLNLPEFDYRLKRDRDKVWIFDVFRKKYVVLTPEEWVRQHVVHFLTAHLRYPVSLLRLEMTLEYNGLKKRSDVVVFSRSGEPWMLIECKAPEIILQENVAHQILTYNLTVNAEYLVVTNGIQLYCINSKRPHELLNSMPAYG